MKRVTIISSHIFPSKRKAGFHWIAEALSKQGSIVDFICFLTPLDYAKRDYRSRTYPLFHDSSRPLRLGNLKHYTCYYPFRPIRSGSNFVDRLQYWITRFIVHDLPKTLIRSLDSSDALLIESTPEISFIPRISTLYPHLPISYRASDDFHNKPVSEAIRRLESDALYFIDHIGYPNQSMAKKFSHHQNSELIQHGIPLEILSRNFANPYKDTLKHAVFFGANFLDIEFVRYAAKQKNDYHFDIIGPYSDTVNRSNVTFHGELPFETAIPFIKYAYVGLNTLTRRGFSGSNKEQIYTYFRLPIISNSEPQNHNANVIYFSEVSIDNIEIAFRKVEEVKKTFSPAFATESWDYVARQHIEFGRKSITHTINHGHNRVRQI